MQNKNYKLDIIPGIVLSLFSIGYLSMIPSIKTFTGLGSTPLTNHAIPYLWGGALLILSLWILIRGFRKRAKFLAEGGKAEKSSLKAMIIERREVIASFAALFLYVGLLDFLGFIIATVLYTFAQILILTPTEKWKKNLLPACITALISGCLLFYVFKYILNVLLPLGILKGVLESIGL